MSVRRDRTTARVLNGFDPRAASGTISVQSQHMFTRTYSDRVRSVASLTLAMALLAALLASTLPLETVAAGPMCKLACCAGRAAHAAGSCMDGSCHAVRSRTPAHIHRPERTQVVEPLCAADRVVRRLMSSRWSKAVSGQSAKHGSGERQLLSTAIKRLCEPDCGSCASGIAGSYSERNVAVAARAQTPRPPFDVRQLDALSALNQTLHALCRQCAPRAPPLSFS